MDLKEAIADQERLINEPACSYTSWRIVVDAAKKQLAQEEAQKPKRASLESIEVGLRKLQMMYPAARWPETAEHAADILKALRELKEKFYANKGFNDYSEVKGFMDSLP